MANYNITFENIPGVYYPCKCDKLEKGGKIITKPVDIGKFIDIAKVHVGDTITLSNGNYAVISANSGGLLSGQLYLADGSKVGVDYYLYRLFQENWAWCTDEYGTFGAVSNFYGPVEDLNEIADLYVDFSSYPNRAYPYSTWIGDALTSESPGGITAPGGGYGNFDNTSDAIDFPAVPTLSAVSAGFVTLFAPTAAEMQELSDYMWSDAFSLDTFKKLFANPMDVVIGLSIVPVEIPKGPVKPVAIGGISSGVSMTSAATQYVVVDCGIIDIPEYWGSSLDYSPYTRFSLYLPYIGTRDIKTDDIMGKSISIRYLVDILSGACTAMVKCGASILYEFAGSCSASIPLTGSNWTQLVTAGIQLAGAGLAASVTGGASAPMTAAQAAKATKAAQVTAIGLATTTAASVISSKPSIQRSGAVSGSAGMLGVQTPYLICERPRQALPSGYNKFRGYPCNITVELSTLTGYTELESVHLQGIPATTSELQELDNLLKGGVIL